MQSQTPVTLSSCPVDLPTYETWCGRCGCVTEHRAGECLACPVGTTTTKAA